MLPKINKDELNCIESVELFTSSQIHFSGKVNFEKHVQWI